MSQNKISILSTGLLDDEFIRDAKAKEILVDVLPFIKTESISSGPLQTEIQETLAKSATIVFTSSNAVEAVASKLNGQKPDWKIFGIGHATRRSVEKYFGERTIIGTADNGKELAKAILDANVSEVIFFCGDQRRDELPGSLIENKIGVKEIVVYKTIATAKKIEKKYDGILFFSPSAVKSFFQENKLDDQTILFAIGNTTADEVKKISKNKIIISDTPDGKTVLKTAVEFFQNSIHH